MGEDFWQTIRDWLLTSGLHIVIILLGGLVGYRSLRVLATRLESLIAGAAPSGEEVQRARTLAKVMHSTALVAMAIIGGLMILRELGLDITPLIAGAGVVGVALGLGAQTLVKSEVILLRLEPLPRDRGLSQAAIRRAEELTSTMARQYLEGIAARVQERGIPAQVFIIEGRPHAEILQFVETNQVDLIVICTRGRSGFSRWLMGSVADRVVRGASVPVLLVRASEEGT